MSNLRLDVAASLLILLASACSDAPSTTTPDSTGAAPVSGYVHAGPVCAAVANPPDPGCDDRPVVDAVLLVVDGSGATVAEARTGPDGRFVVLVPPGTYTLVPQPVDGLLGTAGTQELSVGPGPSPDIDVSYDTGIR